MKLRIHVVCGEHEVVGYKMHPNKEISRKFF